MGDVGDEPFAFEFWLYAGEVDLGLGHQVAPEPAKANVDFSASPAAAFQGSVGSPLCFRTIGVAVAHFKLWVAVSGFAGLHLGGVGVGPLNDDTAIFAAPVDLPTALRNLGFVDLKNG